MISTNLEGIWGMSVKVLATNSSQVLPAQTGGQCGVDSRLQKTDLLTVCPTVARFPRTHPELSARVGHLRLPALLAKVHQRNDSLAAYLRRSLRDHTGLQLGEHLRQTSLLASLRQVSGANAGHPHIGQR